MPTAGLPSLGIPALGGVSIHDDIQYAQARGDKERLNAWNMLLTTEDLRQKSRSVEFQQGLALWEIANHQKELTQKLKQNHAGLSALAKYGSRIGLNTEKWTSDKPEDEMATDVAKSVVDFQISRLNDLGTTERASIGLKSSQANIIAEAAMKGVNVSLAGTLAGYTPEQRKQFFMDNPMSQDDIGTLSYFGSLMSNQTGKKVSAEDIMASYPTELMGLMPQTQKFKDEASGAVWGTGYVARYADAMKQIDEAISDAQGKVNGQRGEGAEQRAAAIQGKLDYYQKLKAAMPKFLAAGAAENPGAFTTSATQHLLEPWGVATPAQAKTQMKSDEVAELLTTSGPIVPAKGFSGKWAMRGVPFKTTLAPKKQVGMRIPYSTDEIVQGAATYLQSEDFKAKAVPQDEWVKKYVPLTLQPQVSVVLNGEATDTEGVAPKLITRAKYEAAVAVKEKELGEGKRRAAVDAWIGENGYTVGP